MTAHVPTAGRDTPGAPGPQVPWAGGRALVDAGAIYIGALFVAQLVASVYVAVTGAAEGVPLVVLVVSSPVALLLVSFVWLRARYGRSAWLVTGWARWRWSDLLVGLGVGIACFVGQRVVLAAILALVSRMGGEVPSVQETFRVIAEDPRTAPSLVLTAVLLAPMGEELVFRGVLFAGLRARWGFWVAALGSGALFMLAHVGDAGGPIADLIIALGILPLGIVFAAVLERRGSLLACIVTHAVYNAGGVALLILATGLG